MTENTCQDRHINLQIENISSILEVCCISISSLNLQDLGCYPGLVLHKHTLDLQSFCSLPVEGLALMQGPLRLQGGIRLVTRLETEPPSLQIFR